MKKLKIMAKIMAFTLIFAFVFNRVTVLTIPSYVQDRWISASTKMTFYDLEKDSIDVLFIGPSTTAAAVDPYQLYEEQGISSYNLSAISEPMIGSYYWLKEAIKYQKPKLVVLDARAAAKRIEKEESDFRKCYDYMRPGLNKLQMAIDYCNYKEGADLVEYIFPISKFHDRIFDLEKKDLDIMLGRNDAPAMGYNALINVKSNLKSEGIEPDANAGTGEKREKDAEYLYKIINLCEEEGIDILLYKTPETISEARWNVQKHNIIQEYADKAEVKFIDFNEKDIFGQIGLDYSVDSSDTIHLNVSGSEKFTTYLGQYLKENNELNDIRNTDSPAEKNFTKYQHKYDKYMENAWEKYNEKLEKADKEQ